MEYLRALTANVEGIDLDRLETNAGAALIFKTLGREAKDEREMIAAHQIVEWVGGLPLALATIEDLCESRSQSHKRHLTGLSSPQ